MNAPALRLTSWRGARNFGAWHLERTAYPYTLLCGAVVPIGAKISRTDYRGWGTKENGDMCQKCVKELDELGAARLRVHP